MTLKQPSALKNALFFAMIFLSLSLQAQTAHQANNQTMLWQVSGNGLEKSSYLFGTYHLMCKEDINFAPAVESSLKKSDFIYMEMDLDDPATMMGAMNYMGMKNGMTLDQLYSKEEYARLEKYFKDSLKTGLSFFQTVKPFFLMAMLYPKMMDCQNQSGVEQELMKIAKENGKEIEGLETMQYQMSVFDSIPYEWQAKELMKIIDSAGEYREQFRKMTRVYKNQQLDSLETMLNASEFGGEEFNRVLLGNRNRNWVAVLDPAMKDKSVFVAVGAGHLPGKEGLIQLLRNKGYKVNPVH